MYKILILSYSSINWNKEIRNGGVSTDCSGSSGDHKIVFGLNCTTVGCELDNTKASRIATTVPLNITQLLEGNNSSTYINDSQLSEPVHGNQSNATATFCYPVTSTGEEVTTVMTAPATSSVDSSLAEELDSIVSTLIKKFAHCNPALDKWKGRLERHQAKSKAHSSIITLILDL